MADNTKSPATTTDSGAPVQSDEHSLTVGRDGPIVRERRKERLALELEERVDKENWKNSGLIDRYYFKALYITTVGGITVEVSTDGPGFAIDEPVESLGEDLSLPPELEENRDLIEAYLTPLR